jgi:hypothetical protein
MIGLGERWVIACSARVDAAARSGGMAVVTAVWGMPAAAMVQVRSGTSNYLLKGKARPANDHSFPARRNGQACLFWRPIEPLEVWIVIHLTEYAPLLRHPVYRGMSPTTKERMTSMINSKTNTNAPDIRSLSEADLSAVSGGQQVYVHEFGIGSVNMATGLRPFEPKMPASPDPEAGLGAYGSTNNNLPG